MNVLAKTLGFSVVLVMLFGGVAYMLPQMEGPAPEQRTVNVDDLTMETFVAMGEELYSGKGTCSLCHNKLGRAPDLLAFNVSEVSRQRLEDESYQGGAVNDEEYLRESMLQPSTYVVAGFGTKGSNDTESPMPVADKAPLKLSTIEIDAIIAFLQDKDGAPVSVALPTAATVEAPVAQSVAVPAPPQSPEELIARYGCTACHAILDSQSTLGPDLNDIASRRSAAQIRESIADPAADVGDGFIVMMPEFPAMTVAELEMIVDYLTVASDGSS